LPEWATIQKEGISIKLEEFCDRFQNLLAQSPESSLLSEPGKQLVRGLLQEPTWFMESMYQFITHPDFLSDRLTSVFDNEIKTYRRPGQSFTVLAYISENRSVTPIHDHSGWGLIGSFLQPLREIKYQRLDDGKVEGYADLKRVSEAVFNPGEVGTVLPLDQGIHQTGANDQLTISLGVYAKSIRRGYIHFFAPEDKKVFRAFPPKPFRKVLALRAFASLGESLGQRVSIPSLFPFLPEPLLEEFQRRSL
jgi:3-mercaptopropionate dioxygenase